MPGRCPCLCEERRRSDARALHEAVHTMMATVAAEYGTSVVRYIPPSWFADKLCSASSCGAISLALSTAFLGLGGGAVGGGSDVEEVKGLNEEEIAESVSYTHLTLPTKA